ncbi:MAG TPA: hypothetical protein VF893_04040 [Candidatus Bathyarchaeia archaeon]
MKNQFKKFHFQELDWLIYFPDSGNKGKYLDYTVIFKDRKRNPKQEEYITLGRILGKSEFENCFPHTVGFFKSSSGEDAVFKPDYMEIRIMRSLEDFWLFLNALNI